MFRWKGHHKFFSDELRMLMENSKNDEIISMVGVSRPEYLIDSTGTTLLHLAARYNNTKIIDYLITILKYKVDVRDPSGASPLIIAAKYENYEAAELLLNANADPLMTDKRGVCALQVILTDSNSFMITDVFIKKVRERAQSNKEFVTILLRTHCPPSTVIFLNDVNITKMFWEQKHSFSYLAKINLIDSVVQAALAASDGAHFDFLFENHDFHYNFKAKIFNLLLDVVVRRKNFEEIQYFFYKRSRIVELFEILTKKVIELDILDESTSMDELENLSQVFIKAEDEILQVFMDSGIVEHMKNKTGYDLRLNLFVNQHPKIRESAQKMTGYDVNSRNHLGQTALHVAVNADFPEVVQKLLYMGADPNAVDRKGRNAAFYLAYSQSRPEIVRDCLQLLLNNGANVQICDIYGQTFIEYTFHLICYNLTVFKPVISKLAMLTVMNIPVKQSILDCVYSDSACQKQYDNHRRELHELTKKKLFRSLTVFSLLSQRPAKIARVVRGQLEDIIKALRDPDCACKESSYYYPILNWNVKEALRINKLKDKAALVIEANIEQLKGFGIIIDNIVEFLTYKDLLMFE